MLLKSIEVHVDTRTWPKEQAPFPELLSGSSTQQIDLGKAFLMLGSLTMPNSLSPASPSRFWAWLRYFLAPALTDDLRVTTPFADLDPHQKAILSDDFGVAIATQWLYDRLGGFAEVIDGRRFLIQFAGKLRINPEPSPKVGPGKAPDFVIRDNRGRWHVLECKGTQSGRGARNQFLKTAVQQKNVIRISGRIRGERLASGLAIAGELDDKMTHLRIIDPPGSEDEQATLELDDNESEAMDKFARRLSVANALGRVGMDRAAAELTLPPEASQLTDFLRPSEVLHYKMPVSDRNVRTIDQIRQRDLQKFRRQGQLYEGREITVPVPELGRGAHLSVKQGINADFLKRAASFDDDFGSHLEDSEREYTGKAVVDLKAGQKKATLRYGDFLISEVQLKME